MLTYVSISVCGVFDAYVFVIGVQKNLTIEVSYIGIDKVDSIVRET